MRGCRQAGGIYNVGAGFTRTRPFLGQAPRYINRWEPKIGRTTSTRPFLGEGRPSLMREAAEVFSFWVGMCSFWAIRGAAGEISNEVNGRFASTSPRNHLAPTT